MLREDDNIDEEANDNNSAVLGSPTDTEMQSARLYENSIERNNVYDTLAIPAVSSDHAVAPMSEIENTNAVTFASNSTYAKLTDGFGGTNDDFHYKTITEVEDDHRQAEKKD